MPQQAIAPQFMGYDATGKPVYAYPQMQPGMTMPQFMGYDQAGHPVYAQPAMPQGYPQAPLMQPQAPAQPVQPVQPAAALVQPAIPAAKPVQPVPTVTPVQPAAAPAVPQAQAPAYTPQGVHVSKISSRHEAKEMPQMVRNAISNSALRKAEMERQEQQEAAERALREPDVHVSKIVHDANDMPDMIRNAMAKAADLPQENIFDQQNRPVAEPIMNDITDILSTLGEDTSRYQKKKEEAVASNIQYEEYKPRGKKASSKKKSAKSAEPTRPLTKEELRDQKRREKIDAQFKKDLAKRGF